MSGQIPSDPPRGRKRVDRSELPVTFLPQGNPRARIAYLCAVIGLIPVVGLLLGPPAVIFGRLGYLDAKKEPDHKGIGHSCASMVLGILETVANGVGIPLVARGLGWV
jgi:hypothetical protein